MSDALSCNDRKAAPGAGLAAWCASDDTGISSRRMARVLGPLAGLTVSLSGEENDWQEDWPHDPTDFGRCIRLLEAAPELRRHLRAMGGQTMSREWRAIGLNWPELEMMYREAAGSASADQLYARMKQLLDQPAD